MIPTHYLQIPLNPTYIKVPSATDPDGFVLETQFTRLLLVEPPTDLSVLPDDIQTVLVSVSMSKGKQQTPDGKVKAEATAQDATGMLNAASQVTRLFVVGAINPDGSNQVMFRLADIHQSVGDLRPLAAVNIDTRMRLLTGVFKYLTSFRCEI